MMKKSSLAACALLAACSGMQVDEPVADAITPLEQACMRDPLDPARWEQLAAALAVAGQRERAAVMYLQAASLRKYDVQQDYATLMQARDEAMGDSMPRTQLRRLGPALVEVLRSGETARAPASALAVRLEISNGNGVAGAAARLARSLEVDGVKTVRLSNLRPFVVPLSRIEYPREQRQVAQALGRRLGLRLEQQLEQRRAGSAYADMRIVLGHDSRYLK
ncbi:LytR C-terminal domain-containing protein [Duganella dendranthematis]|uniref:LytR C-terminal domain-containing protein n=1 Tax=Duganella dendranthematis TaxID=2728021 RepID=A0ABX6MA39_9BURK|nr:LytR C-terminal domain-containing protein [Duganella dendranthematis]QJD90792.1 LytR C-terminal domain-containing protein [Duganella dendranthematis]